MAELVVMPKLGLLMETGVVSSWLVGQGDRVTVGAVIAEITTEKITYELESQAEGTLLQIILPAEEEAPVGAPIAVIGQPGEDISAVVATPPENTGPSTAEAAVTPGAAALAEAPIEPEAAASAGPGGRVVATPAAKKLAAELAVDLAKVTGSGPWGRITLEDVGAAAAGAAAAGAAAQTEVFATPVAKKMAAESGIELGAVTGSGPSGRIKADDVAAAMVAAVGAAASAGGARVTGAGAPPAGAAVAARGGVLQEIPYAGMRRLVGEHMDASRRLAPTVTYQGLADVQELKQALAWANSTRADDDKVNVTAVVVKAVALTLRRMPRFNSTLDGDVDQGLEERQRGRGGRAHRWPHSAGGQRRRPQGPGRDRARDPRSRRKSQGE